MNITGLYWEFNTESGDSLLGQYCFRQQDIAWNNVDLLLCFHMALVLVINWGLVAKDWDVKMNDKQ